VNLIALSLAVKAVNVQDVSASNQCSERIPEQPSVFTQKQRRSENVVKFAQCYVLCEKPGCNNGAYKTALISNETVDATSFSEIKTWLT
jgi:hypothetical protein